MANYFTQCRKCGSYFQGNTATRLCYNCLEKELDKTERALNLACEEVVAVDEIHCPGCPKNNKTNFPKGCNVPETNYKDCWRDYFLLQAKEG